MTTHEHNNRPAVPSRLGRVAAPRLTTPYRHISQDELRERHARHGNCNLYSCRHECAHCDGTFYSLAWTARYCCWRCGIDAGLARAKEDRLAARQKLCAFCGKQFQASRCDSKFCSGACKQTAHRAALRMREGVKLTPELIRNK